MRKIIIFLLILIFSSNKLLQTKIIYISNDNYYIKLEGNFKEKHDYLLCDGSKIIKDKDFLIAGLKAPLEFVSIKYLFEDSNYIKLDIYNYLYHHKDAIINNIIILEINHELAPYKEDRDKKPFEAYKNVEAVNIIPLNQKLIIKKNKMLLEND